MYITYERYLTGPMKGESSSNLFFDEQEKHKVEGEPSYSTQKQKEQFRPTYLVRTDDMKVIPGSTVQGPYYALSYAREHGMNIPADTDSMGSPVIMTDQQHEIISIDDSSINKSSAIFSMQQILKVLEEGPHDDMLARTEQNSADNGIPARTSQDSIDDETDNNLTLLRDVIPKDIRGENDDMLKNILNKLQKQHQPSVEQRRKTNFKGLIQQICKDFNIQYIWFDRMCIDYDDPQKKAHEIRHMHQIYSNAYCTIALVPELMKPNDSSMDNAAVRELPLPYTEWGKSLWTLQEAIASQQILFIGRNTYIWSKDIKSRLYSNESQSSSLIYNLCVRSSGTDITESSSNFKNTWSASDILFHARTRTCSILQDRIFALANMLPQIMENMTISYDQSIADLSMAFYSNLITKDLTLLLFGVPSNSVAVNLSKRFHLTRNGNHTNSFNLIQQEYSDENVTGAGSLSRIYNQAGLPSWTGNNINNGIHIQTWRRGLLYPISPISTNKCNVQGEKLHIASRYVRVLIQKQEDETFMDFGNTKTRCSTAKLLKPISEMINSMERSTTRISATNEHDISDPIVISVTEGKNLTFINTRHCQPPGKYSKNNDHIDDEGDPLAYFGLKTTHILPVVPDSNSNRMVWINDVSALKQEVPLAASSPMASGAWLSLTTTNEKDSDVLECIILSDICYNIGKGTEHAVMPVITKIKSIKSNKNTMPYYKAIGVCVVEKLIEFIGYRITSGEPYIVKKEMKFNESSFIQDEQEFILQ
ncbi:hypothetical protein BDA99DRAFT_492096 [Phascolomyces articulosus]|uniref:Heterokaryon incompatibility domain-containing protein n=1 Tax=Phascolomyces articulosus TaxID=60185 RepID=A0AAD5PJR2_9FUNG|nr:hypothetical protein BDA99DRAFT_492096 [Phascolomyces articulosus]